MLSNTPRRLVELLRAAARRPSGPRRHRYPGERLRGHDLPVRAAGAGGDCPTSALAPLAATKGASGEAPSLSICRSVYGLPSVNIDVWGFKKSSLRAPASHLPDRFQTISPRVMSDS